MSVKEVDTKPEPPERASWASVALATVTFSFAGCSSLEQQGVPAENSGSAITLTEQTYQNALEFLVLRRQVLSVIDQDSQLEAERKTKCREALLLLESPEATQRRDAIQSLHAYRSLELEKFMFHIFENDSSPLVYSEAASYIQEKEMRQKAQERLVERLPELTGTALESACWTFADFETVEEVEKLTQKLRSLKCTSQDDYDGAYALTAVIANSGDRGIRELQNLLSTAEPRIQSIIGLCLYDYLETDEQKAIEGFEVANFKTDRERIPSTVQVWAGHGDRESLRLGSGEDEQVFIDLKDFDQLQSSSLNKTLAEDGHVIVLSCSTDEGGVQKENLAGMLRRLYPQAKGVWAPTVPTNIEGIDFDADGNIKVVKFVKDYLKF